MPVVEEGSGQSSSSETWEGRLLPPDLSVV